MGSPHNMVSVMWPIKLELNQFRAKPTGTPRAHFHGQLRHGAVRVSTSPTSPAPLPMGDRSPWTFLDTHTCPFPQASPCHLLQQAASITSLQKLPLIPSVISLHHIPPSLFSSLPSIPSASNTLCHFPPSPPSHLSLPFTNSVITYLCHISPSLFSFTYPLLPPVNSLHQFPVTSLHLLPRYFCLLPPSVTFITSLCYLPYHLPPSLPQDPSLHQMQRPPHCDAIIGTPCSHVPTVCAG